MSDSAKSQGDKRHERPKKEESRNRFLLRQAMNIFFIVAVVAMIIVYFLKPTVRDNMAYIIFGMFTVLVKIAEMIIRYLPK